MKGIIWVILIVVAIVATVLLLQGFAQKDGVPDEWELFESSEINFRYPKKIDAQYISVMDWPPQPMLLAQELSCTAAGSETDRAGRTEEVVVNGHTYCVTRVSEGAAGTVYTQYAYAFTVEGRQAVLTFSLRFSQCGNFEGSERSRCEREREAFTIDPIMDKVIQSVEIKK